MNSLVGLSAPDFSLKNAHGNTVSLSDYRGKKVVVMFYPFAFTGTCTKELCAVRDNENGFIDGDTVVLSISCDSHFTLRNFADSENFSHELLSDFWPHGEVSRAYGVFMEERGMAMRGTFIVDREGVVRWQVINSPADARDTLEYKAALEAIA